MATPVSGARLWQRTARSGPCRTTRLWNKELFGQRELSTWRRATSSPLTRASCAAGAPARLPGQANSTSPLGVAVRFSSITASPDDATRLGLASPTWHFGVVVVPQQIAFVVERLGKFHRVLDPGMHFLIPIIDRVAYTHSLKEESINIPNQQAITQDNVTVSIDGVLFLRVVDAYQASYGIHNPILAVMQLAQTTMRSEIGKMTLDRTFAERDVMNAAIVSIVNEAAIEWGIKCMRYEIRDIIPPGSIKQAMEMQAEAERRRRAEVLQSEGERQSEVNLADGKKQSAILHAEGEAQATLQRAKAAAEGIRLVSSAISTSRGGEQAVAFRVAEQWLGSWKELARQSNTIIVPATPGDPSAMVATAMSIYRQSCGVDGLSGASELPPADGRNAAFGDSVPPINDDIDSRPA